MQKRISILIFSLFLFLSAIFINSCSNGNIEECRFDSQDLLDCNGKKENDWLFWGFLDRAARGK